MSLNCDSKGLFVFWEQRQKQSSIINILFSFANMSLCTCISLIAGLWFLLHCGKEVTSFTLQWGRKSGLIDSWENAQLLYNESCWKIVDAAHLQLTIYRTNRSEPPGSILIFHIQGHLNISSDLRTVQQDSGTQQGVVSE